jgi:hypothetical protein
MNNANTEVKSIFELNESANLVGAGIKFQEKKEYANAKKLMQQGIDKIKKVLISDNSIDKEKIFEYVSNRLF